MHDRSAGRHGREGSLSAASVRYDLAIVGAGPAGLSAATQASALGLAVALFDEQAHPGGQIYRSIEVASDEARRVLGPDYVRGSALVARFRESRTTYYPRATLSYVGSDLTLGVVRNDRLETYACGALIIATGALERPFPIPGWTLPGVFTAGGVQALLKGSALVPQGRIAIAGSGPLTYLVTAQLLDAGVRDIVVLDTTPSRNYAAAAPSLIRAVRRSDYLAKGLTLVRRARAGAKSYVRGITSLEARGNTHVESIRFAVSHRREEIAIDALLLHQGVVPNVQLTQALGLAHEWSAQQLCWRPVLDPWFGSSRRNVLVAGDSAGISGGEAAEETGRLAALQAATGLGLLRSDERDRLAREPRRRLQGLALVRGFLDRLYRPLDRHRIPAGDTIVCRCEDVTAAEACAAVEQGCRGPNQLKFLTRCGMGPCQGRYCGLTVTELIAQETRTAASEVGYYRLRQPLKPVKLGVLATAATAIEKAAPYKT